MGNNNSARIAEQETERRRISANADIERERLHNERRRQSNRHRREMQEAQLEADLARAESEQSHRERMEQMDIERRRIEAARLVQMLEQQLEQTRMKNKHNYKMEQLNVMKRQIESVKEIELAKIEERREATRILNNVLLSLLDKDMHIVDFTFMAVISSSLIKGQQLPMPVLEKLMAIQLEIGGGGGHNNQNQLSIEANEALTSALTPIISEVPLEYSKDDAKNKMSEREKFLYGGIFLLAAIFGSQVIFYVLYGICFIVTQIFYYVIYCPIYYLLFILYTILYWPVVFLLTVLYYLVIAGMIFCAGAFVFMFFYELGRLHAERGKR